MKGEDILYEVKLVEFNPALTFYGYPNGDSTHYKEKYKLHHVKTLIRGTLRYQKFPFVMRSLCRLGLFQKI